jgi:hypothetical protein
MAWLSEGAMLMKPVTIVCNGGASRGRRCGAEAEIRQVHYRYVTEADHSSGELRQVLYETHYDIDCPTCGRRTQVEMS